VEPHGELAVGHLQRLVGPEVEQADLAAAVLAGRDGPPKVR
jgi:hypothetical protein